MANNETFVDLPEIEIDLTNVAAWDGQQGPKLPVGAYTMDIVSAVQASSKAQQPVLEVTFRVADEGPQNGVELMKKYSLQQQALGRMAQLMVACGARLDKIRPAELVGARIIVEITHVVGQGKVDTQGGVQPGDLFCEISKERAIEVAEQPVAPPPAARKAAPAAQPPAQPTGPKNGSVARRA
jgi:hypothetical protein